MSEPQLSLFRLTRRFDNLPVIRLTKSEFRALPEYSATRPTGVRHGKRWRRHDGAHDPGCPKAARIWVACEYEVISENGDGTVTYREHWFRPVLRGEPKVALFGPATREAASA